MAWYHFIPGVGQAILVTELLNKGFDNKTQAVNAVFQNNERPATIDALKERLTAEINAYNSRISLNKAELGVSKVFEFAYTRGIDFAAPGVGQTLVQSYSATNGANLNTKQREIIEWLNAIQVRQGVLQLIDNPSVKFTFDIYNTQTYPKDAEALKEAIVNRNVGISSNPNIAPKESTGITNTTLYLIIGGVSFLAVIIIVVLVKRSE